ncbi:MAG: phosphoribosylaminoimidazolesuccinocarboxamide synthase, partial [Nitrososphaeraceae archaeon]
VSAYDVPMITPIVGKGEILCKFAEFWFNLLHVQNHMIKLEGTDKMLVKRLNMIPIECVVRGYLYGSLFDRYKHGQLQHHESFVANPQLASKLKLPIFDPTTKSNIHDRPISEKEILDQQILEVNELQYVKNTSISLYNHMVDLADRSGFIIADVKFEFGRDPNNGQIILADSVGPDEFRVWLKSRYAPGIVQESYDKQYLRDWLTKIGFKDQVNMLGKNGDKPVPPPLPKSVVQELLRRYMYVYEKISSTQGSSAS